MKINIGKLLKSIALSALGAGIGAAVQTGDQEVPGSHDFISGVGKLLDKDDTNNQQGIDQIKSGFIQAVGAIDPSRVQNAAMLTSALADLARDLDRVRDALKPAVTQPNV